MLTLPKTKLFCLGNFFPWVALCHQTWFNHPKIDLVADDFSLYRFRSLLVCWKHQIVFEVQTGNKHRNYHSSITSKQIQSCDTPLYSSLPFPLIQEVYFPSITVCNINQVEGSFLKDIDIYGNLSQLNVLYDEYISGRDRDLTSNEESLLKSIQWIQSTNLTHGKSITEFTRYLAKKVMHVYLCIHLFRLMSF